MTRQEAINAIFDRANPEGLLLEVMDEFNANIASVHFDGNYEKAAAQALYEWDI